MSLESEANMREYIAEIKSLKQKYQNQIHLLLAFEMEIVDPFFKGVPVDFINKIAAIKDVDYLIAGYHCYENGEDVYRSIPTSAKLEEMVKNLEILFTKTPVRYIAHPAAFVEGNGK